MKRWVIELHQQVDPTEFQTYLETLEVDTYPGQLEVVFKDTSSGVFIVAIEDELRSLINMNDQVKKVYPDIVSIKEWA